MTGKQETVGELFLYRDSSLLVSVMEWLCSYTAHER